ncbi:MAG TPA: right-handed parallel beta-helix repeat-containing protein [Thermodesulfobacteriota bacterium]|nr:right-handed parallel beta-helix repeat-containing protein [Thermodesulfobacteriota bacterium]
MNRTVAIGLLSLLVLSGLVPAKAAGAGETRYVSTIGSDRNNGSVSSPWATLQHAVGQSRPGDTILVRGGTYREGEVWLRSEYRHCGTPGNLLTIKAYENEVPAFVNSDRPFIVECNYLRVEGLHFKNGKSIGVRGNTVQIVDNTFTGSGYGWDAIDASGNDILLEGNKCDINGNVVGTQGHCYYISHGTNITVRNNLAKGMTGYGIHVFDQRRGEDPPGFERLIKNVMIEGNAVTQSQQRSGIILAAYDHARIEHVIVKNNVVFNNVGVGIFVPGLANDVRIYNNTLTGNQSGIPVYIKGGKNEVSNVRIINNIFDNSGVRHNEGAMFHVVNEDHNPEVSLENNLYWPKPVKLKNVKDPRPITGDPLFADPPGGDFRLKIGSAAIDQGMALEDVPRDRDGVARPQNSKFDVGAYEYH